MTLEFTCAEVSMFQWERLMADAKPFDPDALEAMILEHCPGVAESLSLGEGLWNPWHEQAAETDTHYIYVHSAIEYFFCKEATV